MWGIQQFLLPKPYEHYENFSENYYTSFRINWLSVLDYKKFRLLFRIHLLNKQESNNFLIMIFLKKSREKK